MGSPAPLWERLLLLLLLIFPKPKRKDERLVEDSLLGTHSQFFARESQGRGTLAAGVWQERESAQSSCAGLLGRSGTSSKGAGVKLQPGSAQEDCPKG